MRYNIKFRQLVLGISVSMLVGTAYALPALQLGPTTIPSAGWSYNTTTATWDYVGGPSTTANLSAFANATGENGGNGDYAWDALGATNQYAYLVVAASPQLGNLGDLFNINVSGATLFDSGFGAPPEEDPNSMAPHGIYATYYEIYQFMFDGTLTDISNTEPPGGGTAKGYKEDFGITINSLAANVTGLHFDLFTTIGDGTYTPGQNPNRFLVGAFAPFSHDAQWTPGPDPDPDPDPLPVPGTLLLLGLGLLGLRFIRRTTQ